ncbi:fatty acid desaturase [Acuticoccus kandeliae]|uniref:fatty acid desaturase n=1 Tax=Acuticoccus kandeliae TaxID=2073160 RepID=UPI00196AED98|nr:fatty acid desaturase [Acuticoccus kandeliae]
MSLALLVVAAWLAVHILAIYAIDWGETPRVLALPIILVATWLFVGLFIIAHDCMHGSLAPGRPRVNRTVGRIVLALYVAMSYDRLLPDHHKHHRRPGTDDDPDFDADHPRAFLPWFVRFMRHYFGWRELLTLSAALAVYFTLFRPPIVPFFVFYALPAILSAVQLFYFGTYRPHRLDEDEFVDAHRTRTNDYPWLLSLLTCFHFGYHHEHHLSPTTPWWRLPKVRRMAHAAPPGATRAGALR